MAKPRNEVTAWAKTRNAKQKGVQWQIKVENARIKLQSLYPKNKLRQSNTTSSLRALVGLDNLMTDNRRSLLHAELENRRRVVGFARLEDRVREFRLVRRIGIVLRFEAVGRVLDVGHVAR